MNIPATPSSSAGLIDRLAGMAEGLQRSLDEDGGGSLGEVLFVLVAVHCLMRIASLYLRFKAGLLAPLRTHAGAAPRAHTGAATKPHAVSLAAAPDRPSGAAHGAARQDTGCIRPDERDAGVTQAPDADAATVSAASLLLSPPVPPGYGVRRGTPPRSSAAAGAHILVAARLRPCNFRRVTAPTPSHDYFVTVS